MLKVPLNQKQASKQTNTSAEEVMFPSALACLFVNGITQILLSRFFAKVDENVATWATEETTRFWFR